jgi:hypothetical protein
MFPLFAKDGLIVAYTACVATYIILLVLLSEHTLSAKYPAFSSPYRLFIRVFVAVSVCRCAGVCSIYLKSTQVSFMGMLVLHALCALVPPPARFPHLYPALFSIYGAANLSCAYVYTALWLRESTTQLKRKGD